MSGSSTSSGETESNLFVCHASFSKILDEGEFSDLVDWYSSVEPLLFRLFSSPTALEVEFFPGCGERKNVVVMQNPGIVPKNEISVDLVFQLLGSPMQTRKFVISPTDWKEASYRVNTEYGWITRMLYLELRVSDRKPESELSEARVQRRSNNAIKRYLLKVDDFLLKTTKTNIIMAGIVQRCANTCGNCNEFQRRFTHYEDIISSSKLCVNEEKLNQLNPWILSWQVTDSKTLRVEIENNSLTDDVQICVSIRIHSLEYFFVGRCCCSCIDGKYLHSFSFEHSFEQCTNTFPLQENAKTPFEIHIYETHKYAPIVPLFFRAPNVPTIEVAYDEITWVVPKNLLAHNSGFFSRILTKEPNTTHINVIVPEKENTSRFSFFHSLLSKQGSIRQKLKKNVGFTAKDFEDFVQLIRGHEIIVTETNIESLLYLMKYLESTEGFRRCDALMRQMDISDDIKIMKLVDQYPLPQMRLFYFKKLQNDAELRRLMEQDDFFGIPKTLMLELVKIRPNEIEVDSGNLTFTKTDAVPGYHDQEDLVEFVDTDMGTVYKASKQILSYACKYFEKRFYGPYSRKHDNLVIFENGIPEHFEEFLNQIYHPTIPITHHNVDYLLALSTRFMCLEVICLCEEYLVQTDYYEFVEILTFVNKYDRLIDLPFYCRNQVKCLDDLEKLRLDSRFKALPEDFREDILDQIGSRIRRSA